MARVQQQKAGRRAPSEHLAVRDLRAALNAALDRRALPRRAAGFVRWESVERMQRRWEEG